MLVADFAQKKQAAILFSPLLTNISTHNIIKQFQSYINIVIINTNDVYTCYDLCILFRVGTLLTGVHQEFLSATKAAIIIKDDVDCCGYTDNSSYFCKS